MTRRPIRKRARGRRVRVAYWAIGWGKESKGADVWFWKDERPSMLKRWAR